MDFDVSEGAGIQNYSYYQNMSNTFTDRLTTYLLQSERGMYEEKGGLFSKGVEAKTFQEGIETNWFEVIERNRLSQIMNEQNFSNTGLVNENQATQIGQIAGVDAIITGTLTYVLENRHGKVEVRTKDGTRIEPELYRKVEVSYKMRLIDVTTGKILGNTERSYAVDQRKQGENIKNIFTFDTGIDQCLGVLSYTAANYLTPRFVLDEFEFEKIKVKNLKDIGEDAAKKAEVLDINGAYLLYEQAYEEDSFNDKLLYNMGIIQEIVGNFSEAQEFYQQASELDPKEKKYKEALKRNDENLTLDQIMTERGIEKTKYSFEFNEQEKQLALAEKVQVKGKDSERINVYIEPAEGSKIVAKVPGGMSVTVLEKNSEWYLVRLVGNKQGYIQSRLIK